MTRGYRIDTMNLIAGDDLITQKVPTHATVQKLNLRINSVYDTGVGGTVLYDGVGTQIIDNVRVGAGTRWPIKIYGVDMAIVHGWLQRNVPSGTGFTPVVAVGKLSDLQFTVPVGLSPTAIPRLSLQVEYANNVALGAFQTIVSSAVNGRFKFTEPGQKGSVYKIMPNTEHNIVTGTQHIDLLPEGRLSAIIAICRDSATPFARANLVDDAQLRIEGDEKLETDWEEMQTEWQDRTGDPYPIGVGVMKLEDKPLIGNNSRFDFQLTASAQMTFYLLYEPPNTPREKPITTRQISPRQGPIRGPQRRRGGETRISATAFL